ncbi:hypothetical protein EDB89DRAFT_2080217 [Lactarius sanguifluus]|nr:hypothetical protein EDB89DRAFT_2080217 [Lactarius sanguifluus]
MTVRESVVHDRVNLVRLVSTNPSTRSTGYGTQLTAMVQIGDGATELVNCLEDIHGLLDRLGACVLSVNERVAPEPSLLEPYLPTVPCPSPCVPPKPDLPTAQRLAQ